MSKVLLRFVWVIGIGLIVACNPAVPKPDAASPIATPIEAALQPPTGVNSNMERLIAAYPDFLLKAEGNFIIWKDGTKMIWDDGLKKNASELESSPDLEDMFHYVYEKDSSIFELNYDPGRIRNEAFFKKMYGESATQVKQNLATIEWLPSLSLIELQVTKINGVDQALTAVSAELAALGKTFISYLKPLGGTFNWRKIAGTDRLSIHSFGAAIDLNVSNADYWRWSPEFKQGKPLKYRNRIPSVIVKIFEKHGFIWGGKWYHYDTMHFEYRPELL